MQLGAGAVGTSLVLGQRQIDRERRVLAWNRVFAVMSICCFGGIA